MNRIDSIRAQDPLNAKRFRYPLPMIGYAITFNRKED